MKKYLSLQIMMLTIMAGSAGFMHAEFDENQAEAVQAELQAQAFEESTHAVLHDLAVIAPAIIEQIIEDEADLDETFNNIKQFITKKNKEIEALDKQEAVTQEDIARIAVELADTQAMFAKYVARQRAQDKENHKHEDNITSMIRKANRSLQLLQNKFMAAMNYIGAPQAFDYAKKQARSGTNYAHKQVKKQNKKRGQQAQEDKPVSQEFLREFAAQHNLPENSLYLYRRVKPEQEDELA